MNKVISVICNIFISIIFILSAAFVLYVGLVDAEREVVNLLLIILFFILSYFIMPVLHELGHVIMGKIVGFRLASLRLSFVEITNTSAGKILRFCNPFSLSTAGDCSMYPKDTKHLRRRFFLWASGGLFVQAVYLAVAIPLLFFLNNVLLWTTLGTTVPYCLYLFLINILPFSDEYDGGILWGLVRNEPSLKVALAVLTVQGMVAEGRSVGEVEKDVLFSLPVLSQDDVYYAVLQYYRYLYYLDLADDEQAFLTARRIEDALEYIPEIYLPTMFLELAFAYSFIGGIKERGEDYHAQVLALKEEGFALDELRSKLAYARLTGNTRYEEELYGQWQEALEKESILGVKKFEEKLMRRIRNENGQNS